VDSCTAIVEHFDGDMELVEWRSTRLAGLTATPAEPQPASEALVEEIAASVMPEAGIALLQPEQHRH
jgi:hypothetical protein